MFRLHKTKPAKSGERVDFKFSHFKVVQVPKGWDKLFVSIISLETGKTVAKCGKATVKNGNCQWNETVSQSIWISHDHYSSKETDQECLFKLVVAMGSTRSGILGEAEVNMASYMTSGDTVPVSLPLKKNNNETTLQVKIQCLTPRAKLSDEESKSTSEVQDAKQESHAMELKSEESEAKQAKNEVSGPLGDLDSDADKNQNGEKETSLSTSNSDHNYDSAADSMEKESLSSSNNLDVNDHKQIQRLDSSVSQNSLPAGSHPEDDQSESSNSSFNSRITYSDNLSQGDPGESAPPSVGISGSSKSLLETAEDTIEELKKEAKTWERNARKLMLDFDTLKKDYLEQSKTQASLEIELSAASAECEGLQKEVEQLKLLLEKSVAEQAALKDSALRREGVSHLVKELENEIKFQEESNANLSLQLKRSQESNAELVAVLQELEETIEKQKADIETLSCLQTQFDDIDSSVKVISEINRNLKLEIEELQESEKKLQAQVKELEQALEERNQNTQNGSSREHFSTKEKDSCAGMQSVNEGSGDLIREIEELKSKLQELESDCQELTDENLDLLLKLKETRNNSNGTNHKHKKHDLEENMRKKLLQEIANDQGLFIKEFENLKLELEDKVAELSVELNEKKAEIEELEADLLSKEKEIRNLESYQQELESKLDVLHKEKDQIQESMANVGRESDISTKCMIDLQKDLTILTRRLDSQVSANKSLERKSLELEKAKKDLELHLSETTEGNRELSARISDLEAQLSSLTEETESTRLEQESSKSLSEKLNNEIAQLREEMKAREMELQEMDKQFSEAQSECEYLRSENQNLQARTETLMEECNSLRRSNGELKRKNKELQGNCEKLDEQLRESQKNFADCSMKVNILEETIASVLEESDSKGKILASEMDQLNRKTDEQNEQLNLLNKMYSEKNIEIENLQQELSVLSMQLSAAKEEKEKVASDAVQELSGLEEVISKLESELNAVETEFQAKIQDLTNELTISKQNQEILRSDNKRTLKMLANYQSCEDDFKTTLNDLELKLTVSEYERQQLAEESNNLKAQLQKTGNLQDEVGALKNELKAIKNDKAKLQTSLDEVLGECKKLKAEKNSLLGEITTLKKSALEFEDSKQDKIALEQKLLQMEHDLMAKDALCEQDAELKKEISRTRRANKQLQEQIQQLEEYNHKCKSRVQSLEKELLLTKEEQNRKEFKDGANKNEADSSSKMKSLEDELEKATKANQTLKIQMKKMMSEGRKTRIGSPRKPTSEEVVPREKFERTKSSLETELIDLRERYLNMSLKYAQVEAEREELVMKLKTTNNARRWFK